jgi:PKD repeat protein
MLILFVILLTNMRKKLPALVVLLLTIFPILGIAQINSEQVDPGPYGRGSNITVPNQLSIGSTNFAANNTFTLFLSDATGNFANERMIGSFAGFFSRFINGVIPGDAVAGTAYRMRIKSSSPALVHEFSTAFQVVPLQGPVAGITAPANASLGTDAFGWCGTSTGDDKSILFGLAANAPSSQTLTYKNEVTQATGSVPASSVGYDLNGISKDYYTLRVSSERVEAGQTIKSNKSYLLLNQPTQVSPISGEKTGCIDPELGTGVNINFAISVSGNGGIQNNYPGSIYRVNWGDKQESTYTHAEVLRLNGQLVHNYKNSSCGEPPIDLGTGIRLSNSFKISITSQNTFCSTISNPVTSYAQIYAKPVAKIDTAPITAVCVNKPVLFSNKSIPGTNANCSTGMAYRWYVDGTLASDKESFVYAGFATTGSHKVRLVVSNDVGSCSPSEDEWTICVQNPPEPSFNLGTNTTACVGTIFRPDNTSKIDNSCNTNNSFRWDITGGPVTYVNGTSATSEKPEFSFNAPGIYKIKLVAITASCGEAVTQEQTIVINATPTISLSPNAQLCSLGTYKFCDCVTGPTLTRLSGTQQELADTYTWTVTGGEYEFESSTANTKYPNIKFLEYKTYTITVTHKNSCGTETKTQTISFIPSPTIDIQTADTICFDDPIALRATITGDVSTQTWVGGNGTFSAGRNALSTDYIPTAAERAVGRVELTLRITTALAAPCAIIEKSVAVIIRPKASITSAPAIANCNNAPLNYTITSNLPGTTYTWTATGPASVTGFTSGSGNIINDVLINANGNVDANVIYTITPTNNGCPGVPFTLTATIGNIKNDITTSLSTICSGQEITITGNDLSTLAGYSYVWERSVDNGATWTVIPNQSQKDLKLTLTQSQVFRRSVSGGNCSSTSETIQINVLPPLENNILNAVPAVCEGFAPVQLTGSVPTGGDGNYNYQWQSSVNGGATWTNIDAAVLPAYQPGVLSATTLFRRLVSTNICSGPFQSVSSPVAVNVNPKPKAEFTFAADKSCAPFLINAQNVVATAYPDRNDIYTWYANDVLIGTGISFPNYTITTDNTFITIKLVVSSQFGCSSDSTSRVFSTQQTVNASFNQTIEESCGPTQVTFRNTTPALPGSTYLWDFGNGVTTNVANPVPQSYPEHPAGRDTTYTVKLTVRTSCGDNTFTSRVLVKALPRAVFSPSKTSGCSPMVVTFTNTSPGTGNTYYFDFGDGTPPLRKTDNSPVTHTFVSGTIKDFVVSMITENSCGRSEATTYKIRVSPNTVIPELVVNSDELAGCAPFTVNFHNNSSGATSYVYDFGDGTKAGPTRTSPETMTHTFTKGGIYVVTLTASNGCSDTTTTETITVYDQPMLQIAADQVEGCPGLNVKFRNESVGGISYVWDFGDGSPTSTEFAPEHVYTGDKEFYTVTLTAVNALGCSNTRVFNQYVHIIPPPLAKFNVVPGTTINIPNYTFQFEDESENNPDSWTWDFGDGTTSNLRSPKHSYPDTGSYTVTLRVTNQFNCYTETSKIVEIVGVPGYLFVPNAFMPNSGTEELRTFKAKGSGLASYRLSIFNKWGELLWQTDKLEEGRPVEGWDGTYKSTLAPQGTYIWKIDAEFINKTPWKGMSLNGSTPKRTGTINLIR